MGAMAALGIGLGIAGLVGQIANRKKNKDQPAPAQSTTAQQGVQPPAPPPSVPETQSAGVVKGMQAAMKQRRRAAPRSPSAGKSNPDARLATASLLGL